MVNILNLKEKNHFSGEAKVEKKPTEKLTKKTNSSSADMRQKSSFGSPLKINNPWAVEDSAEKVGSKAADTTEGALEKTDSENEESIQESPVQNNLPLLEWSALEFVNYHKSLEWFMVGGIIAFVLLALALFTKNLIFALIIILASFSIFIWTQKEPQKASFAITNKGILINKKNLLNFENLKSFWIFNEPSEMKYISLESKKVFMPRIPVPLGKQSPGEVRQILLKFLPEKEQEESLIDALGKHLRY